MMNTSPVDLATPAPATLHPLLGMKRGPVGNLPFPPTALIGREREIEATCALLRRDDVRQLSLTGLGGVGKTRLAIAIAAELTTDFPDGTWFVGLASIRDPELVASTIAESLGVDEGSDTPLRDRVAAVLRDRHVLLLLDNFEHVVAAAPIVAELLATCPKLKVLVTSRVRLRISGEFEHVVPPLALPGSKETLTVDEALQSEAVRLFVARGQAVHEEFVLTAENAPIVTTICRRLDGLPLAIELAAARLKVLPPSALLARLEQRLPLLTGGSRDVPARLQSMRDAIAWSYDLLTVEEQALFRRLAVFVGGFSLDAAETVATATGDLEIEPLAGITVLVDASLIKLEQGPGGDSRYLMLETIREYGLEQLQANGELEKTRRAHALWCLAFAEDIAPEFIGPETFSPEGVAALNLLAAERDNVRAALDWATEHGDAEIALRLVYAFKIVWSAHGHVGEGKSWSERALALPGDAPVILRASMLITLAWMTSYHDDIEAARSLAEEGLALARSVGDANQEYWALRILGWLAFDTGDLDQTRAWFEESLAVARSMNDRRWEPSALTDLGGLAYERGDFDQAAASFEAALPIARTAGDREAISNSAGSLAVALAKQGEKQRAAALLRESLSLIQASAHTYYLVMTLSGSAILATIFGRAETAARLLGAYSSLRSSAEIPTTRGERRGEEPTITALRDVLGEAAFEAAWAEGATLPLEMAIVEADAMLAELAEEPEPSAFVAQTAPGGLTSRELTVLRLLVEGASDKEIAEALGITRSTASKHVETIRSKLGVSSRTAAATYATRHGLI